MIGAAVWVRDRTTSPLQMGQVRRRVVSQGVLLRRLASRGTKDMQFLKSTGEG